MKNLPNPVPNITATAKVVKDRPDLRDLEYKPTLQPLHNVQKAPTALIDHPELVRNQLDAADGAPTGTCTAHALAAVIDILRSGSANKSGRVSAEMLYHHGLEIDGQEYGRLPGANGRPLGGEGLWSLRSAIKAFYHNGVCSEKTWAPVAVGSIKAELKQVELYKEARKTPLGSYYRLQPILNDYHAALNEVQVIYAAAEIHGGWDFKHVDDNKGVIVFSDDTAGEIEGNHAFAIVGYTADGFLVMNSWGSQWGGYTPKGAKKKLPGVALWPYYDWAERILDGWVLRLGVSAPEAFKFSFGRQGLSDFLAGKIQEGSTPRLELIGHYVHMDDGEFVENGAIPSTIASLRATCSFIEDRWRKGAAPGKDAADKPYDKVLLWIPGGSEGVKDILAHIASTKKLWKLRQVYPITVIWCSDLLDQASALLTRLAEGAFEHIGRPGPDLDSRIERDSRAIGRAVWRDVARSAKSAARQDLCGDDVGAGAMQQVFCELSTLPAGIELHIVAEGTGAVLMHKLLSEMAPGDAARITSLSLIMPGCSVKQFQEMIDWMEDGGKRINLLIASKSTKERLRFGPYGGSLLDLVQMCFVENPPPRVRGKPEVQAAEMDKLDDRDRVAGIVDLDFARRHFALVNTVELELAGSTEKITNLRDLTAGKQAIAELQTIILGKGVTAPSDIGTKRAQKVYETPPFANMPNDVTMP